MLPKLFTKKFLGIDVGTSSIRVVELEKDGQKLNLLNYGQIDLGRIDNDMPMPSKRAVAIFSVGELAEMIQAVIAGAKIKTRRCAFSIPDFSTFFTTFGLPLMTQKELPDAVMFEARQHIPLPIDSVTIDWNLIAGAKDAQKMEVTVAAIPNEIISQYKEIAAKAKLEIVLLEAEMFGLMQALVPKEETRVICLIDIGAQSTVCSFVENQSIRYSHSFDRGSNYLVDEFLKRLPMANEMAREIREKYGLKFITLVDAEIKAKTKGMLREILLPIFKEIEMMFGDYRRLTNSEAAKIILSGGAPIAPEIKENFSDYFKKETEIADPFKDIHCHSRLEAELKAIGPVYAVAVGMARRGLEFSNKH